MKAIGGRNKPKTPRSMLNIEKISIIETENKSKTLTSD